MSSSRTHYKIRRELCDSLQGKIYLAYDSKNKKYIIMKESWKKLVIKKTSRTGHYISENILNERYIQKYLSSLNDCHNSITKCLSIWDDTTSYWIALEKCDHELLNYILKSFDDGNENDTLLKEAKYQQQICLKKPNKWVLHISNIFKQLCNCINYLHNKNICHMDISLENIMLNELENGKIEVKLIDFGLAKMFDNNNFMCDGRIGKMQYMSPETWSNCEFDARSNDIYCLGVCLFMMLLGCPPYTKPDRFDTLFDKINNGDIELILRSWKRLPLITENALDLLKKMLCNEDERITMSQLLKHPFLTTINENEKIINKENIENKDEFKDEIDNNNNNNNEILDDNLCGLDDDENDIDNENKINNINNDDNINKIIKKIEQTRLNQMKIQLNQNNKPLKMKRIAKIKLNDWGFIQYESNLVNNNILKISDFEKLNEIKLTQIGFTKIHAQQFIIKYKNFKGISNEPSNE